MIADAKEKARVEFDRIVSEAQAAITQQKNAALIGLISHTILCGI